MTIPVGMVWEWYGSGMSWRCRGPPGVLWWIRWIRSAPSVHQMHYASPPPPSPPHTWIRVYCYFIPPSRGGQGWVGNGAMVALRPVPWGWVCGGGVHGGILGQKVLRTTYAAAYIYYIKNIPCRLTEVLLFMDALRISRGKLRCTPPPPWLEWMLMGIPAFTTWLDRYTVLWDAGGVQVDRGVSEVDF